MKVSCFEQIIFRIIFSLLTVLATAGCIAFVSIDQPAQARVGQIIVVTLVAQPTSDSTDPLTPYLSFRLPHGWAVVEPVTYDGNYVGNLTHDPALSTQLEADDPKDGYFWWVGRGADHAPVTANLPATMTLRIQIGNKPGFYELDYLAGAAGDLAIDARRNIPITITADHGAAWSPAVAPTTYAPAGKATGRQIPLNLVNLGDTGPDSFNLSAQVPPGWSASFVINGVLKNNTGSMTPLESIPIELQLTLPSNALPGEVSVPVIATSTTDPGATATALAKAVLFGPEGLTPPAAQAVDLIQQIGAYGLLEVQGKFAYLGEGYRLAIWDISNPAAPKKLGRTVLFPSWINRIVVDGQYAYLALQYDGLRVIDLSNPNQPVEASLYDVGDNVETSHLVVEGNYAYLGTERGLHIIDMSNPTVPHEVRVIETVFGVTDMVTQGSYLYLLAANRLHVIDMANSPVPIEVGVVNLGHEGSRVIAQGNTLYLASKSTPNGLTVIDISNPTQPLELSYLDLMVSETVTGFAVAGNAAYMSFYSNGLKIIDISNPATPAIRATFNQSTLQDVTARGNYAYLASRDNGLTVLDASNPANPVVTGVYNPPGVAIRVSVIGRYAYVTFWGKSIDLVDISNPAQPVPSGQIMVTATVDDVAVVNHYAYLATHQGLQIIDVTNPAAPKRVGLLNGVAPDFVTVAGNYAYIVEDRRTIRVVDVSSPHSPQIVASVENLYFWNQGLTVAGDYLFTNDFTIIDISTPTSPVMIYTPDQPADTVAIKGNYAYLATATHGLDIVDISDPRQPALVGTYIWSDGVDSYPPAIAVAKGYAYLSTAGRGFRVIDISDPTKPVEVGANPDVWGYYDAEVVGNYVHLVNGQGLYIVDVSNPSKPKLAGFFDTPGIANRLDVAGGYTYVADTSGGLFIFRHAPSSILPPEATDIYLPIVVKKSV